jgi:DNA helicase HerA-like ATPase
MPSDNHISYIGTRFAWGGKEFFGIQAEDRRRHLYTIGKTGTSKTTLLRNLIVQDIEAGRGVGVIDPHGDLAQSLLDLIPRWRTEDVVYFDPADQEHPIAFNPLDSLPPEQKHLVASGIVSAFKNVWRDSWGARTEYILYAAVAALLDCESATLLGIQRMLSDERYRE